MICQNCSTQISEEGAFCAKCGHRAEPETLISLGERIARMEAQLAEDRGSKGARQDYLELETAERVMARVKTWANLILYFTGIPAAVALLALAVMFGKGAFDLNGIAARARDSVSTVLSEAKSESQKAATAADDALKNSQRVKGEILETRVRVGDLKNQVENRISEVQKLNGEVKSAQARVETMAATVNSQTQQVAQLSQKLRTVEANKNLSSIREAYPGLFGEQIATTREGTLDPKAKKAGEVYIGWMIWERPNTRGQLDDAKVADVIQSLRDHKYTVFLGPVSLTSASGNTSQGTGTALDARLCGITPAIGGYQTPCIVYFSEKLRASALETRSLVRSAEAISDDRVLYIPPEGMNPQLQELLKKSAIDIVVVFGAAYVVPRTP